MVTACASVALASPVITTRRSFGFEIDLSNPKDLRVVMTGLASATDAQAVTIHFGSGEFTGKYKMLVDNFSQWQANAGRVQSIDLQYSRQVVVNPDVSVGTTAARTK